MTRYRFLIEYDGRPFAGWQVQANASTVQGAIEAALGRIGETAPVMGAGRTDAGVHARGQVAHADLAKAWEPRVLRNALNFHLRPHPVSILEAAEAPPEFHARFDAVARRYRYRILNRPAPPALDDGFVWWRPPPLDADAMGQAARHLIGHHDFTTFRDASCQAKSPLKTLDRLDVGREGDTIDILAEARSFLHHQVRSMVGTLERVGASAWTPGDVRDALEARDRLRCGPVAPPGGLTLMEVRYPLLHDR